MPRWCCALEDMAAYANSFDQDSWLSQSKGPCRPHPHQQHLPQGSLSDHRINLKLYKLFQMTEDGMGDVVNAQQVARC